MKKLVFILGLFLSVSLVAQDLPLKVTQKYFDRVEKNLSLPENDYNGLDCFQNVFAGAEYKGVIATPSVAFTFASVITKDGTIQAPAMGLGYLVSIGRGTGLATGELEWRNKFGLGVCITTGFKPETLKDIPVNLGVYAMWHNVGIGYYYDTMNKISGISFGGNISLTKVGASILNLRCIESIIK